MRTSFLVRSAAERAAHAIQEQHWLDTPSQKVEHGLALVFNSLGPGARPVQDLLHGTWLGHPLHSVLTDFPLGAWTVAVALDAADVVQPQGAGHRRAARGAVEVGLVTAAAAAASGITDWQYTHDGARRAGLVHGTLNTLAIALFTRSWLHRRRGQQAIGVVESGVGYVTVLVSAYLGGGLVYRHRVGVDHTIASLAPHDFVPVLEERELAVGVPQRVEAGGVPVVLVRDEGRVHAVGERCPHLGGPLSEGWMYRGQLVCPWHGSRFRLHDGEPASGPATAPLACFETRVEDGWIQVRRRPPVPSAADWTLPARSVR